MSQPRRSRFNDIAFVERRNDPRIILSIAAQYSLANKCDADGERREFPCRIVNISTRAATLFVPVNGAIGEHVVTHSDEFGRLEGVITRVLDRGFVIIISATTEERGRLAAKIEGYEKIKNYDLADRRKHKRVIPKDPRSFLVFADNSCLQCFIIDVSTSGAAVSADIAPKIGTPLAVGALVGRVARHFGTGFAVQFVERQKSDGLEQRAGQP